jgi:hypothetical protein
MRDRRAADFGGVRGLQRLQEDRATRGEIAPWLNTDYAPKPGQFIRVCMLEERPKRSVYSHSAWLTESGKEKDPPKSNPSVELPGWREHLQRIAEIQGEAESTKGQELDPFKAEPEGKVRIRPAEPMKTENKGVSGTTSFRFATQPLFQGSVHEVRLRGRTRRKIIRITLADACRGVMGGKPVPLQSM